MGNTIDAYQTAVKGNKVSSEQLVGTLNDLLFFTIDSVSEALGEMSPAGKQLSPPKGLIRMRDALKGQKDNVETASEATAHVEMILSKTRADQFFGYIGGNRK